MDANAKDLDLFTNRKAAGSIPDEVIGFFNFPNPCSRHEVDSSSNRNEYQEYLWG
jgi:hypothetical protein